MGGLRVPVTLLLPDTSKLHSSSLITSQVELRSFRPTIVKRGKKLHGVTEIRVNTDSS